MRRELAACYRTVGASFLDLVRRRIEEAGTDTNLLDDIRYGVWPQDKPDAEAIVSALGQPRLDPEAIVPGIGPLDNGRNQPRGICGCPANELLPGLMYCAEHRPRFGSNPRRRYDRRASNPIAGELFSEPELGGVASPTARAIAR
jgi:hypothetical protein